MKNEEFDRLLSAIRNEQVDDQVVAQAGERVWKSIAGAPAELSTHTLRTCEDFQALVPGYLSQQLAPARAAAIDIPGPAPENPHRCAACACSARRAPRQSISRRVRQPARPPGHLPARFESPTANGQTLHFSWPVSWVPYISALITY